ncbi:hypothetical protein MWU76_12445 [Gelidibacter sp. F2691]|nr:hypothetical protein [Gelidibacter sp. F2691]
MKNAKLFQLEHFWEQKRQSAFLHLGIAFAEAVLIWINNVNPFPLE